MDIIEQRKNNYKDFLNGKKDQIIMVEYNHGNLRPHPNQNYKERIEWALRCYELDYEKAHWLADDTVPYMQPYTGTEIFAEALGCRVHRSNDKMPFALPLIHEASEVNAIKPLSIYDCSLAKLFEIGDALKEKCGKNAVMQLPDIQSPFDIAALIWEKGSFFIALIDEQEAVLELIQKVEDVLFPFLDEWLRRYGTELVAHYPGYFMDRGITLSEDEVGSINSDMFKRFCEPSLVKMSKRYDGLGMHCCANSQHQWQNFMNLPDLRVINITHKPDICREAYAFFGDSLCHMHFWCGDGEPSALWLQNYPKKARVIIHFDTSDKEEAIHKLEELRLGIYE